MTDAPKEGYFHSVHLLEDKCKGCVNCIKRCPTEAIRVRDGKAHIIEERCIDCGECVRTCPNQAKTVVTDSIVRMRYFKYNVALPAPALYGQFAEHTDPRMVVAALIALGFDYVVDVAFGADIVARKINEFFENKQDVLKPLISSACPAVVRLIQVRFPSLVENIIPVITPMRAAALAARFQVKRVTGLDDDDIGVFFISPCPAKASAISEPAGFTDKTVTGAIGISDIYPLLREKIMHGSVEVSNALDSVPMGTGSGVNWARAEGEAQSLSGVRYIAVDGIHSVVQILDEIERGKLQDIDYIEAQACIGGCLGGVLTVENPFITRQRVGELRKSVPAEETCEACNLARGLDDTERWYHHDRPIEPRPTLKLDDDMGKALRKREQMEKLMDNLPGLDCGSCGAPNCQAFAEDVVRGLANELDCIFKLREKVRGLAGEMMELAEKVPPPMHLHENKEAADEAGRDSAKIGAEKKKLRGR